MKKWLPVFIIALIIVALDQVTKIIIANSFKLNDSMVVISGFFNLTYLRNKGAAFSFLANANSSFVLPFLISVSVAAIGVIFYLIYAEDALHPMYTPSLSLVLGGALGNLIDRIFRGEVVDFLDFYIQEHHWPPFNVADSAITVGAFMLALCILTSRKE